MYEISEKGSDEICIGPASQRNARHYAIFGFPFALIKKKCYADD